jgi:hypothetical protein
LQENKLRFHAGKCEFIFTFFDGICLPDRGLMGGKPFVFSGMERDRWKCECLFTFSAIFSGPGIRKGRRVVSG